MQLLSLHRDEAMVGRVYAESEECLGNRRNCLDML